MPESIYTSVLGEERFGGLPERTKIVVSPTTGQPIANPVGDIENITRQPALDQTTITRNKHPKLNTKPWSTSLAVKREEPPSVKKGGGRVRNATRTISRRNKRRS